MTTKNGFWLFFTILLILHTLIVVNINFFPFTDVPNHLTEGTVFRYYQETSNFFNQYYTLHYFFYPNTFHLFFFSLPIFPDVEIANKVLHLLIVISLPILVFLVINELKGNKWFVIISFVLVYGYNLTGGFTGNAVANNVIMLILWIWLRLIGNKGNSFVNMALISVLLVFVYFLHAMVALYCLLMVFVFIAFKFRHNFKKLFVHSLSMVPLSLLILYWWFFIQKGAEASTGYHAQNTSTLSFMKKYYLSEFLPSYIERGRFLLNDNFQLFQGLTGYLIGFLLTSIILVPIFLFIYKFAFTKEKNKTLNLFFKAEEKFIYIYLFFGVTAFCYFLLPNRIQGQEPLYERFSTILLLALMFIGCKIPYVQSKSFSYAAVVVAFIHAVLWGQYFWQFDQENKDFVEVMPQEKHTILSYMNFDPEYRGRTVYAHFQNYFIVKNLGIASSKVIDYRFGMIRRKESGGLPYQGHMYLNENPRQMLKKADYILVRGEMCPKTKMLLDSMNVFSEVKKINKWSLLKKRENNMAAQ